MEEEEEEEEKGGGGGWIHIALVPCENLSTLINFGFFSP